MFRILGGHLIIDSPERFQNFFLLDPQNESVKENIQVWLLFVPPLFSFCHSLMIDPTYYPWNTGGRAKIEEQQRSKNRTKGHAWSRDLKKWLQFFFFWNSNSGLFSLSINSNTNLMVSIFIAVQLFSSSFLCAKSLSKVFFIPLLREQSRICALVLFY